MSLLIWISKPNDSHNWGGCEATSLLVFSGFIHFFCHKIQQGPFAYLVTHVASHAGIFELTFADLLISELLQILAPSPSLPFCAMVSIRSGEYFPPNSFSVMVSVGGGLQGWFPLAGLPWILPCYAWGVQAPLQPLRHQFLSSSIGDEFKRTYKDHIFKFQGHIYYF